MKIIYVHDNADNVKKMPPVSTITNYYKPRVRMDQGVFGILSVLVTEILDKIPIAKSVDPVFLSINM